jgi:hypothetical protein
VRALGYRDGRVVIGALAQDGSGRWRATVGIVPPPQASYALGEIFVVIAKRSGHWRVISSSVGGL